MRYTWIVRSRFLGEFDSPLNSSLQRKYYCIDCGDVFATVFSERGNYWNYYRSYCGCVVTPADYPYYAESNLRCPLEVNEGFAPIEILAEEFLIEFARYPKDSLCQFQPQT